MAFQQEPALLDTRGLSDLAWIGHDRVWRTAADTLLAVRQPLAAARCYRVAAEAFENRLKRQVALYASVPLWWCCVHHVATIVPLWWTTRWYFGHCGVSL